MLEEAAFIPYTATDCLGRGRALFFAPHPDDEVLGCTGALRGHLTLGDPVRVIVATDGAWGGGANPDRYRLEREHESRKAAQILGYPSPLFWRLRDRFLAEVPDLTERVLMAIDDFAADWVYAPSWWEVHPDHRALAQAVTQAARARPDLGLILYEVGVPLQPNRLVDLTPHLALKRRALRSFKSQLELQAYDHQILGLNAFRAYTLPKEVVAAEAAFLSLKGGISISTVLIL